MCSKAYILYTTTQKPMTMRKFVVMSQPQLFYTVVHAEFICNVSAYAIGGETAESGVGLVCNFGF